VFVLRDRVMKEPTIMRHGTTRQRKVEPIMFNWRALKCERYSNHSLWSVEWRVALHSYNGCPLYVKSQSGKRTIISREYEKADECGCFDATSCPGVNARVQQWNVTKLTCVRSIYIYIYIYIYISRSLTEKINVFEIRVLNVGLLADERHFWKEFLDVSSSWSSSFLISNLLGLQEFNDLIDLLNRRFNFAACHRRREAHETFTGKASTLMNSGKWR